ncbi:MAG: DcrB-related protein [Deltaproteobacteria bacterium]|nr:DcrB-related protein [Deltaproteobacteria bacterium]
MALSNQLQLTPPPGFLQEEVVTSFRSPPPKKDLKTPAVLQFQANVRPNLIVTRRLVPAGTSVAALMASVAADLARHIRGLSAIETTELKFKDGTPGILMKYTFPAHERFSVLQFQAGRVDGDVFTNITLSTEPSRLQAEDTMAYLECIASATVQP